RRQHLTPQAVDVGALIEGMTDLVSRSLGPRIRLTLAIDPDLPPAHVDPNQLELALLNLAVNGRDAMADQGELTFHAEAIEGDAGGRLPHGRYLRISVTDTGAGMDEETLKRAVEPFFTTKGLGRGTGLGLSSVQGLTEQSGGAFDLASQLGQGATATLWLPVSDQSPVPAPVRSETEAPMVSGARVLLVDDEAMVRAGVADMLVQAGYDVIEAWSAGQALDLLTDGLAIDILVTDYAMPGMTGAQLGRSVGQLRPGLPVLMITGYASLGDSEAENLPRLAKPFRQAELAAAVAGLLEPH
ncbi:MAG: response regulator, partial [Caulobacteraceae bacterium]|nr:response regulator [Caulobacteraceae bacterium]